MVRAIWVLAILIAVALWQWRRRARVRTVVPTRDRPKTIGRGERTTLSASKPTDPAKPVASPLRAVLERVRRRFWHHALGLPARPDHEPQLTSEGKALQQALLNAPLDPRYFPRRPMLMPQLLSAVHDPNAAPRKLADIVAQDPVLAGDVLKLANSAYYRRSAEPVETIQRAIIVCGTDGLQSLVAAALVQPVFRHGSGPLASFPGALWDCTARCAMAAEMRAQQVAPAERFSAQLLMLLSALGPLVVFRASQAAGEMSETAQTERLLDLIEVCGTGVAQRVARDWNNSERLVAAIAGEGEDAALNELGQYGLLMGTLAELALRQAIGTDEREAVFEAAGLARDPQHAEIWLRLTRSQ